MQVDGKIGLIDRYSCVGTAIWCREVVDMVLNDRSNQLELPQSSTGQALAFWSESQPEIRVLDALSDQDIVNHELTDLRADIKEQHVFTLLHKCLRNTTIL